MKRLFLTFFVVFLLSAEALFAVGEWEFCIVREATGWDNIGTTALDMTWDTSVREDATCSLLGNSTDIEVVNAGHYLVLYSLPTVSVSGTNRSEIQTWLRLNDSTNLAYGRGHGYIRRNQGDLDAYNHGAAILDLAANDDIRVQAQRTDSNTALVEQTANRSGLQIIKLDDSWNYIRTRPAVDQTIPNNTTFQILTLATDDEIDAGSFSRAGGNITLNETGKYLIAYNVGFNHTSNTRGNYESRITLDGVEVNGTRVTTYIRGSQSTRDGMTSWVGIIDATATDVLNVEIRKESFTANPANDATKFDETAVAIVKIPNDAEFIMLEEAWGWQDLSATRTPIDWDTAVEEDTASFDYNGVNPSRVELERNGDYLFFHSLYATKPSGGVREVGFHEWLIDGSTLLPYGSSGGFLRGDQGSADTFTVGSSGGSILHDMLDTNYVEVTQINEATNANATYTSNRMGLQATRICTLFNLPWTNSAPTDIALSNSTVTENNVNPTTIGTISSTDANTNDTAEYSLVSGAGDTDNGSFSIINGDTLQINTVADFETQSSYSIRMQVQDCLGSTYEEILIITVINQNAPGGVENNLLLWLRANTGVTGTTNVTAWQDQSTSAFTATATTGPERIDEAVNFNPTLQFNGSNEEMLITNGILGTTLYTDNSIYTVTQTNTIQASTVFWENPTGSERLGAHIPWSDNTVYYDFGTCCGTSRISTGWWGVTTQDYIWGFHSSTGFSTPSGTRKAIYRDGLSIVTNDNNDTLTGNNTNFYLGSGNGSVFYDGDISEFITHTSVPSATEHNKIQSYLAIKYGITLDQWIATDYTLSDDSVAWDASVVGTTYDNDIAGIAQDDESALDQTKSKSENTDALLTIEESGGGMDDGESFMWSNNDGSVAAWTMTETFGTFERVAREWYIEENNGDVGNVTISVTETDLPAVTDDVYLLIDTDGDFSTGASAVIMTESAGVWSTTTNLADGQYITIGHFMGTMDVTIVDGTGTPVASPNVDFTTLFAGFTNQTSSWTLGIPAERIRADNQTVATNWSITLAAAGWETEWDDGWSNTIAYDDDGAGVQLEVQFGSASITAVGGSSLTGTALGTDTHFSGTVSSITLMTCTGCDPFVTFDIEGIILEQDVPALTPTATYEITMEITIL